MAPHKAVTSSFLIFGQCFLCIQFMCGLTPNCCKGRPDQVHRFFLTSTVQDSSFVIIDLPKKFPHVACCVESSLLHMRSILAMKKIYHLNILMQKLFVPVMLLFYDNMGLRRMRLAQLVMMRVRIG
ncbi:uncharacterized protein LOC107861964 [Capsicum annuum]|uniref:uncharacterized protein LOC107861964 n=1 Tax=Capsicum annuum TaxID=4072 RepID=UPI0007BF153A|nr:uncharacterized protein LOC107861964 [Capsicum annuum]